ncbi:hypothetical protein [Catellatospora sp. NPDC049609]|uniref:hypothetical protein n=1 Tax=Catellatospora sp. NPDC049609 TaxID=3155505 RepID=UPI0034378ECE
MNKATKAVGLGLAAAFASLAFASPAAAAAQATPREGAACVRAGVSTLIKLGLLRDAALRRIDYSTLADPANGPIFADLPEGSYLSLGTVVKLHYTNPELFAWCK